MAHKFWRKETVQVAIVSSAVSATAVVLASALPSLLPLSGLKKENQNLRDQLQAKTSENQQLNILLTPFKTIALERYSGSETEALAKLGLKLQEVQTGLNTLTNYQGVARLGPDGKTGHVKEPLREESPLIDLLAGAWEEHDGGVSAKCTPEAIAKFQEATEKFPDFPFSFCALAICLKRAGNAGWSTYADKAITILERTTTVKEHHPGHDEALRALRLMTAH